MSASPFPTYGVRIELGTDTATPFVARVRAVLGSSELRKVIARGLERDVRDHLIDHDRQHPNANVAAGWKRSHIMRDAARATRGIATDNGVHILIHSAAIGLRYFGGTVVPVKAGALAIPVDPRHPAADPRAAEAYGQSPRAFHHLRLVQLAEGRAALVANDRTEVSYRKDTRKATKGQMRVHKVREVLGGVYYWIVKSATIKEDKTILPTDRTLLDSALVYADKHIASTAGATSPLPGA